MKQRELEWNANMNMKDGSIHDRILAAKNHMKLIQQRMQFQMQKTEETRLAILEESITNLAIAYEIILEAKEKLG